MYQVNQTAGAISAGPAFSNKQNIQKSKPTKVTFPLYGQQFTRLKRYLASENLQLEVHNDFFCKLRVSRDSVTIYLDPS